MKKELSNLLTIKVKADIVERYVEFYTEMRNDLELLEADYMNHFKNLGEILFKIDSCNNIQELEWAWSKGELDLIGESFQDFLYNQIISLGK